MTGDRLEAVRESRDALETLAESDLACSWVAEALLDAADEAEEKR